MKVIEILRMITEVMTADPVNLIVTIIGHTFLLLALVFTIFHLVKLMFESEEKEIVYQDVTVLLEKRIS